MKQTLNQKHIERLELSEWEVETLLRLRNRQVVASIKHVSQSGMTRQIAFAFVDDNQFKHLTHLIAKITGYKLNKDHNLVVKGCGMDMIFSVLSNFNYAMAEIETGKSLRTIMDETGERIYDKYWINANHYEMI